MARMIDSEEELDELGGGTGGSGVVVGAEGGVGAEEVPVPVNQHRNRAALGEYEAPYDQNDIDKAKKRGRRESRMATAGHVMDTMARLLNYASTTQGAPSAHWANRNQEFDRNTYYAKLKGENDKARQDYMAMRDKADKSDNEEYKQDISLYDKRMKYKDKEAARAQNQPLVDAGVENKNADTGLKNAQAESERIRAMYLPDKEASQIAENYSSAAKNNRDNEEYVIYEGNGRYKKYPKTQKNEWGQEVRALAQKNGISLTKEVQTVTNKTGNKAGQIVVTKTVDKTDEELAKELTSKFKARES